MAYKDTPSETDQDVPSARIDGVDHHTRQRDHEVIAIFPVVQGAAKLAHDRIRLVPPETGQALSGKAHLPSDHKSRPSDASDPFGDWLSGDPGCRDRLPPCLVSRPCPA